MRDKTKDNLNLKGTEIKPLQPSWMFPVSAGFDGGCVRTYCDAQFILLSGKRSHPA
jgi:hypothetical protein